MPDHRRRARGVPDRGAVTAELAMALPLLLSVTVGLVWLLSVAAAQVRVVDAAREGARALARGDDQASAVAAARRVAPAGAEVHVASSADDVEVSVSAQVSGPGGLLGFLPAATVHADAHGVAEEGEP